jgi:hypothetical protein
VVPGGQNIAELGDEGEPVETELIALTSTGAATLVGLLITDRWQEAGTAMGSLWRRAQPDRADGVEAELGEARCALLAARSAGNDQVALGLIIDWRYRIDRLLAAFPQTAVQLRRVVEDELAPALAAAGN